MHFVRNLDYNEFATIKSDFNNYKVPVKVNQTVYFTPFYFKAAFSERSYNSL